MWMGWNTKQHDKWTNSNYQVQEGWKVVHFKGIRSETMLFLSICPAPSIRVLVWYLIAAHPVNFDAPYETYCTLPHYKQQDKTLCWTRQIHSTFSRSTYLNLWSLVLCMCTTCCNTLVRSQLVSLEFFIDIKSYRSHYSPGIDSASNITEHQEHFLGVKAAGA